jgi:HSP20 family protein
MKPLFDGDGERIQAKSERAFSERPRGHWRPQRGSVWHPPTDVYETDDSVVVTVEIAGLDEGDYQLTLTNRLLTVRGRRRGPTDKLVYHQMEIRYGEFRTEVHLPWPLREPDDETEATYQNGLLRVVFHRAKPRRVPVTLEEDGRDGS